MDADGSGVRVLTVMPDFGVGGAERVAITLTNAFRRRGYDAEVVVARETGELRPALDETVPVTTLPPARSGPAGVAAHLPALARHLRRRAPAVVFAHMYHVGAVAVAAGRLARNVDVIPVAHTPFDTGSTEGLKSRAVGRLVTILYPSAARVVAVSETVAASLVEQTPLRPEDVTVLHNPVEVAAIRDRGRAAPPHRWLTDDDRPVVTFVGRLAPEKALDDWLRAFARVHDAEPAVRGLLLGEGPERDRLERLADRLGVADRVSFEGFQENPYAYLARSDTLLLTSRVEGLPTVLIESLACGCPVVATDCQSGPREVLADGTYGRLVPVGEPAAAADAVRATLASPPDPERLVARARAFAPESVVADYETLVADRST